MKLLLYSQQLRRPPTTPDYYSLHPPQRVYCDSYDCPYGYALIDKADDVKCKWGKCKKSQCCDKVCSSYDCPDYYEPVDHADTTVCKDYKCTKDQCCEKGESAVFEVDLSLGFTVYHTATG